MEAGPCSEFCAGPFLPSLWSLSSLSQGAVSCCTRHGAGVFVNERIVSLSLNGHHLGLDPFSPTGSEEAAVGDFTALE